MYKEDKEFRIRTYSKKELALRYFPDANDPHTAVNHLNAWIRRCKPLVEKLAESGYYKTARYFSPLQVREIVYYLGEP